MRGAEQGSGAAFEPVGHHIRGQVTGMEWGTWTPGEKAPCMLMVAVRYYRLVVSETVYEIDLENMDRIINGVHQLAEIRVALGL